MTEIRLDGILAEQLRDRHFHPGWCPFRGPLIDAMAALSEAERERDELRLNVTEGHEALTAALQTRHMRAEAAERALSETIEALRKYGHHAPDCLGALPDFDERDCSCGFRALLVSLEAKGEK